MDSERTSLNIDSFFFVLLPPIITYYVLAALVCIPGTISLRLSLLPPVLVYAYAAGTKVDLSYGEDRIIYLNQGLVLAMTSLSFRAIIWGLSRRPYRRLKRGHLDAEDASSHGWAQLLLDASDLAFGLRGIGWDWSKGLHIPPQTRRTSPNMTFVFRTFLSLYSHTQVFDFLHYIVQSYSPHTFGSTRGGTIFDENLPPLIRYSQSTFISFLSGLVVYCAIQVCYDLATMFGVVVFGQHPNRWPPVFDEPWKATSLHDFWQKRWHQLFRHFFIGIGGVPGYALFGRIGAVLGAFFVSGLLHYLGLWGMGRGSDFFGMIGFFEMMGVGVILEGFWKKCTGRRVGGWLGRIWTAAWLIGWSNFLVDAWARKGLIGSFFMPDAQRIAVNILGPLC